MAHIDWDKVATHEFEDMDEDTKRDWADLRQRVSRRSL